MGFEHAMPGSPPFIASSTTSLPRNRQQQLFAGPSWASPSSAGRSPPSRAWPGRRSVNLLGTPDCSRPEGRRDAALLWFLYNTGARAQEVVDTRLSAVRFDAPAQVRLNGKGRKERLCPLWVETVQRLRHMLRDRQGDQNADEPLFLNATGRPLTRFGLRFIVRRCVTSASASHPELSRKLISPHTFRHTTALHLLQSGVELNVVRSWLGHASIETTHAYMEIDMDMKRAALAATTPQADGISQPRWRQPDILAWLETL